MGLTYEDYAAIPNDGRRHEIIDGEHFVNPAPNVKHQTVVLTLASTMRYYALTHRVGHAFISPIDVLLDEHTIVQPDIVFVSHAREHIITRENIQGVPDLLIEILSPGTRRYDKRTKYERYELAGVPEYWIVDPEDDVVEVFRQRADKFARIDVGDTLTSPILPGFALSLRELFA